MLLLSDRRCLYEYCVLVSLFVGATLCSSFVAGVAVCVHFRVFLSLLCCFAVDSFKSPNPPSDACLSCYVVGFWFVGSVCVSLLLLSCMSVFDLCSSFFGFV